MLLTSNADTLWGTCSRKSLEKLCLGMVCAYPRSALDARGQTRAAIPAGVGRPIVAAFPPHRVMPPHSPPDVPV
jgi:hypothetical protein